MFSLSAEGAAAVAPPVQASATAWLARVPWWFAPAALGLGVLAGLTLIGAPAGLGLTLLCIALVALTARAAPHHDRFTAICWIGAGLLAMSATLRSAVWLVALALLGALALSGVAAVGGRRWAELLRGAGGAFVGLVPGPVFLIALAARIGGRLDAIGPVLRGALIAGVLVLVFGGLFASADEAFGDLAGSLFDLVPAIDDDLPARIAVLLGVIAVAGGLIWTACAGDRGATAPDPIIRGIGITEWAIALVALDLLFAIFVGLQVGPVLDGPDVVANTAGITYSSYAREGFFQLLFAAALSLVVIAAARRYARVEGERERRLLEWMLGGLCVLVLCVLAVAIMRIDLYVGAFGSTRLRLFASAGGWLLGGVFVLLLIAGAREALAKWLPRAVVVLCTLWLIGLVLMNPDLRIAQQNVARFEATGKIDAGYLRELSPDAVPALAELPSPVRERALRGSRASEAGGVLGWNLGRARADRPTTGFDRP